VLRWKPGHRNRAREQAVLDMPFQQFNNLSASIGVDPRLARFAGDLGAGG